MKILLTLFLVIFACQVSFGQEKPKAEKIDEFGTTNCEILKITLDSFLNEFILKPNDSIGYVVIYSSNRDLLLGLDFENRISGHFKNRLSAQNRIFVSRKQTEGEFKVELWKLAKDEKPSFSTSDVWDLSTIKYKKPTLFFTNYYADDCQFTSGIDPFSEILSANQNLRGHIVIFENSQKGFLKTKNKFLSEIKDKYNVPQNQLRTFFVKIDREASPYHELWLVPKRRKS